jgi:HTH-type transcriptional regulator/antitoxin HipB
MEMVIMLIHSPNDLAQYYRDQRKQRDVSQTEVAEETAVRQDTVSKFENKPDNVRLNTLFRLLSALDLEMHLIPKEEFTSNEGSKKKWTEKW